MRLRRDRRANVLPIMAAAIIPLAGLIGGAVDMSRLYITKTRLQQACDAGALAGRKVMSGGTWTANSNAANAAAVQFFDSNFLNGSYGSGNRTRTFAESGGIVTGTASVTLPMTVMKVLGFGARTLSVTCEAEMRLANTDIMFVLDVSGTMNCAAADTQATCLNNGNVEKTDARIIALRSAVTGFYDTVAAAAAGGTNRLRLGFAPYSTTVNVGVGPDPTTTGTIFPTSYLADSWNYQSRVANFNTAATWTANAPGAPVGPTSQTYGSSISQANCTSYGTNTSFSGFTGGSNPAIVSGTAPNATTARTYSNNSADTVDWGWSGAPDTSAPNKSCRRRYTEAVTTYTITGWSFTNWTYQQEAYDTSQFKAGTSVTLASGSAGIVPAQGSYNAQELAALAGTTGLSTITSTWLGCIEERDTLPNATFTFGSLPAGAKDLDIDTAPTSDATTKWRTKWGALVYNRTDTAAETNNSNNSQPADACPKRMGMLAEMTRAQVVSYLTAANGFIARGGTYHDVGILWGARLLSPTGIFSANNATAPNGRPIGRHIIYMTDGEMRPDPGIYTLYGHEKNDRRVMGSTTPTMANMKDVHNSRFSAICAAAKAKNITVWVVAFVPTVNDITPELTACATDTGKAFVATNDADLLTKFQLIASQIANLRLTR